MVAMQFKTIVLLGFAGLCGLVAMLGVQQVLSNQKGEERKAGQVLVATAEILPGQPLDGKNTAFKDWPQEAIPEGAVVAAEQVLDRTLKLRLFPGDLITEIKLNKKGVRNPSSDVPAGMRVSSVPIDPTMTGSGLIKPGDKVDVLVSYATNRRGSDAGIGKEIKTVLQCIEVFAIDGLRDSNTAAAGQSSGTTKNVSLLVKQEQGKLLKLAEDVGKIHLMLRPNDDNESLDKEELFDPRKTETVAVRSSEDRDREPVVNEPDPKPEQKPEPTVKKWKIQIFSGEKLEEVEVEDPGENPDGTPADKAAAKTSPTKTDAVLGTVLKLFGG